MTQKFRKGLNIITIESIADRGNRACKEFRDEYSNFILWYVRKSSDFDFFAEIPLSLLAPTLVYQPLWKKFLLEHNFIKEIKEPPKIYKIGDLFESKGWGSVYRLHVVSQDHLLLLSITGCSYYGSPAVSVQDVNKVTEIEFCDLTRGHPENFTKIEEEQK